MRRSAATAAICATLLAGLTPGGSAFGEDSDGPPSQTEVRQARQAADDKAGEVASVQAALLEAQARLQDSMVGVAQAEEAFNRARWLYRDARRKQRAAERVEATSQSQLGSMREEYADMLVSSYEMSPSLNAMSAILHADGIDQVIHTTTTMHNAQGAMDQVYDDYDAAALLAGVAADQATQARTSADRWRDQTNQARTAARELQGAAADEAAAVAAERARLIGELARLQGISVSLAEERQAWLESQANSTPAPDPLQPPGAPNGQANEPTAGPTDGSAQEPAQEPIHQPSPAPDPGTPPSAPPTQAPPPATTPPPAPTPTPVSNPPAPAGGARAAIAFAEDQIGEPYQWAAAGPSRWDCSGLTMKAWEAGGISLPHYSVGQYLASTPISRAALRPGDLVFWGSSSSPSSIYHVALYVGGGMMIHAPRTGQDVAKVSIDYWIPPGFFARP